jgi:hypothetical protein
LRTLLVSTKLSTSSAGEETTLFGITRFPLQLHSS